MDSTTWGLIGWQDPWLLAAALPAAAAALWLLLRTGSPLRHWRRGLGGAGLVLCVVAALLGAAGLFWHERGSRRTVWILVDRSLSAGDAAERKLPGALRDLSAALGEQDFLGVIAFSDRAEVLLSPQPAHTVNADLRLPQAEASDETWLTAALELAAQHKAPDTEAFALLIGDGHDSALRYGSDLQRDARNARVRLFALPVDSEPLPESAIADCSARLAGDDRQLIAIDLVVFSTVAQTVTPQVKLNGQAVEARLSRGGKAGPMRVDEGRTPVRLLVEPPRKLATYVVEVSLAAEMNSYPRNDSLKLVVRGPGEARVLVVHGEAGPERALVRALRRAGVEVTDGGPGALPSEAVELAQFQAVVLSDVPANEFAPAQLELLNRFVRDGAGLCMIGGPRSFAPGGYYESAVEKVLPVTCDVVEKGRKSSPALLVTLDRSGSMGATVGGSTKMELANEGCARAIQLASPTSYFGMLAVDTEPHWVVPMDLLRDRNAATNLARTNNVGGGGIYTNVAMQESIEAMRSVQATSKHIVLFSDGSDTEQKEGVIEMVRAARETDKITVSTICMGDGPDWPFLQDLARAGGGRAFLVTDASQLPAVFSREAALSGGNFLREEAFRAWPGVGGSLTEGVDFRAETTPQLLGYVATTARPEAHVWLWSDKEKERPLLATWNVELGRAMAFASDARDRWADKWLPWDRFDELWQRWVRWLLPQPEALAGVEPEWSVTRQGPALTLRFFDEQGNPRALADPAAELSLPSGGGAQAAVIPVGSGTYSVQFNRTGAGMYAVSVRERKPGGEERLVAREMQVFVPLDELLRRPADKAALAAVARVTGGDLLSTAAVLAERPAETSRETVSPRDALLWLAAIGLLLGIAARRLPSVWRRREAERARASEASRVLTARDAFDRVRKTLQDRQNPPERRPSSPFAPVEASPARVPQPISPPPPPPAPEPGRTSPEKPTAAAAAEGDNLLLSAVRKVRRQLDQRDGDKR